MAWSITDVSANFSQNRAGVVFTGSGGLPSNLMSVTVSFPLGEGGQPAPASIDRQTLITRAKQLLTDAAANATEQKRV